MNSENELIGSAEAAKLLGIERTTLYQWTSKKLIPFIRVSRNLIKFDRAELQSWIVERRIEAIGEGTGQRPGRKATDKVPTDGTRGKALATSKKEKPKDSARSKERRAKKIKRYARDARELVKKKEKRRERARQKAIEDEVGRPDV